MTLQTIKHISGVHRNYVRNFVNGVYNTSLNYKTDYNIHLHQNKSNTTNAQQLHRTTKVMRFWMNYIPIPAATFLMSRVQWKCLVSTERIYDYAIMGIFTPVISCWLVLLHARRRPTSVRNEKLNAKNLESIKRFWVTMKSPSW